MKCSRCQHENTADQKFCGECGARLAAVCSACGAPNPPAQKFCGECGASQTEGASATRFRSPQVYTPRHLAEKILTSKAALEGERKQVTVLFADLKGSMELLADRDPEEARKILDPVLQHMMDAVHRYEGTVNQVTGDGIMALFGAPLAHEDHAVRACYAALRMQDTVRRYSDELRRAQGVEVQIRVGLNSGDVVVRASGSDLRMDYTAIGQTTHLAARMEQLAAPGSVRLTAETLQLAEGFSSRTCTGSTARPRPCSIASSTACPRRASCSSSTTVPSTSTAGAARPTTASSASIPCRPRTLTSCSRRSLALTRPSVRSSDSSSNGRKRVPSSSRKVCGPWWRRRP